MWKNKGEKEDLKYYRPLSLMNSDYKIFTEILMQRLVKALGTVIGDYQSAFLPKRQIDDNIRTIQYLIARGTVKKEDFAILFLDQEKAYDRVSYIFMWRALRQLRIPDEFVEWVKAI